MGITGKIVAERFRNLIHDKGLKSNVLAQRMGMSKQVFSNKLLGKSPLTLDEITNLCDLLDLSRKEKYDIFFTKEGN